MSFRIGQRVVCVDDVPRDYPEVGLLLGEIYTVIGHTPTGLGVFLKEFRSRYGNGGFFSDRFRPVDETFGEQVTESIEEALKEEPVTV